MNYLLSESAYCPLRILTTFVYFLKAVQDVGRVFITEFKLLVGDSEREVTTNRVQ